MKSRILISACLLGEPVRYNGRGLTLESELISKWEQKGLLVPLCPEVAAGFSIPRPPAEIVEGKTGVDILGGIGEILEDNGSDVTETFISGAEIAVRTAREQNCKYALLTDGSPSCGSTFIYSGNHDGIKREGSGVVTAALRSSGIKVFAQHQIKQLAECLVSE